MSQTTCLTDLHVQHGGRMVDFAGWLLPVQFAGVLAEHIHTREAVSLFDTGHMGQFHIEGTDAARALGRALTQDAEALAVGRGKYGFLLNDAGGVIDDTILLRLSADEFLLVVNAGTAGGDETILRERLTGDATLTVRRDWGKLDVQGPGSAAVLGPITSVDLRTLGYFGVTKAAIDGHPCVLGRTGYTGELGYEIFMPAATLPAIAETLLADDRVALAGLGARDSLRLEMGYPLYGHELNETVTPIEAGLAGFVNLDREFVGADALRKQTQAGPARTLVALQTQGRRQIYPGDAIILDGREVGEVTSGVFSPSLRVAIGLGFVETSASRAGEVLVRTARADVLTRIVKPPFYKEGTCRIKW